MNARRNVPFDYKHPPPPSSLDLDGWPGQAASIEAVSGFQKATKARSTEKSSNSVRGILFRPGPPRYWPSIKVQPRQMHRFYKSGLMGAAILFQRHFGAQARPFTVRQRPPSQPLLLSSDDVFFSCPPLDFRTECLVENDPARPKKTKKTPARVRIF